MRYFYAIGEINRNQKTAMGEISFKWHSSIHEITESNWLNVLGKSKNIPFYKWEWLYSLEKSKSVCNKSGWQPIHLSLWRDNYCIAIAPLYLKNHSFGEFIFDQIFAKLSIELGLNYYPKIIGMSPFSPIEGYRFFIAPEEDEANITNIMLYEIDQFALSNNILSCNFLYVDHDWSWIVEKNGYLKWLNKQSIWEKRGAKDFGDYLARFNSNQRKNIKKERKYVKDSGFLIKKITGSEINEEIMKKMHDLYKKHCNQWGLWGSKYLSEEFFLMIANKEIKENIILFSAQHKDNNDNIAMSMCMKNKDMLWGRYWGSKEKISCLHFEVCYYSPISWALEQGISYFDPGAGGGHKQRRGFQSKSNISLHKWHDSTMNELIKPWLKKVNNLMIEDINATNNQLPIKIELPKLILPEKYNEAKHQE